MKHIPLLLLLSLLLCSVAIFPEASDSLAVTDTTRLLHFSPSYRQQVKFHRYAKGIRRAYKKDSVSVKGFTTANKRILNTILLPAVEKQRDRLLQLPPEKRINEIALFCHEVFRKLIGISFYRWGGDILDLDDAQNVGVRHRYRYGLDCSGFAAMPYEVAVLAGLLDSSQAVFSSRGFAGYCAATGFTDGGGAGGTHNGFRPDSRELAVLGREIFRVPKGGRPTPDQVALLQPGDQVGRPGHVGLVVAVNGKPYYFESGGWVSPVSNGNPYPAAEALEIFARNGDIAVRRCLPDKQHQGK